MKYTLTFLHLFLCLTLTGQRQAKRVLFLGNSYTSVNNLPQMIKDVAASLSDTVVYDSNSPGGYRLLNHSTNPTSLAKISEGNWDYVVLQEQSQFPAFPDWQVAEDVFPYAHFLDSLINSGNSCAETVFYMTWGRKNGDASNCAFWPPVCSYTGMDSLLNLRYRMMALDNSGVVSPVGAVWKYIRQNFPQIELYQADESHPSVAGTYAAACCFYAVLFRKDPTLITFNSSLSSANAEIIRSATKMIVYDNLINWRVGNYDPSATFEYSVGADGQITFTNNSLNATDYLWDFGDGNTSITVNPQHTYTTAGTYDVKLLAAKCAIKDSIVQTIQTNTLGFQNLEINNALNVYPNPTNNEVALVVDSKLIGTTYVLYNTKGSPVLDGIIKSTETCIELQNLNAGMYVLVLSKSRIQTFNILKE